MSDVHNRIVGLLRQAQDTDSPDEALGLALEVGDLVDKRSERNRQWSREHSLTINVTPEMLQSLYALAKQQGLMPRTVAEIALREYVQRSTREG